MWALTEFFGKLPVRTFELLGHKSLAQIRTPTPTLPAVTFLTGSYLVFIMLTSWRIMIAYYVQLNILCIETIVYLILDFVI